MLDVDGLLLSTTSRPNLIRRLEYEFSDCDCGGDGWLCAAVAAVVVAVAKTRLVADDVERLGKMSAASLTTKYFSIRWRLFDDADDDDNGVDCTKETLSLLDDSSVASIDVVAVDAPLILAEFDAFVDVVVVDMDGFIACLVIDVADVVDVPFILFIFPADICRWRWLWLWLGLVCFLVNNDGSLLVTAVVLLFDVVLYCFNTFI